MVYHDLYSPKEYNGVTQLILDDVKCIQGHETEISDWKAEVEIFNIFQNL